MTEVKDLGRYVPYEERTGNESIVYFTRDISPAGIMKVYEKVNANMTGKVAVKLHTGEPHGPNIIPSAWVKEVLEKELPDSTIVETNTYYKGDRYTTEQHRETLKVNGWTFRTVDIMDEEGTVDLPVNGKWFDHMTVGSHMPQYDSLFVLTHFKGHTMGGFGGSNKNIGIGCADGRIGKGMIHAKDGNDWGVVQEELMEKIRALKDKYDFIVFFGDGIKDYKDHPPECGIPYEIAHDEDLYQMAASDARLGEELFKEGCLKDCYTCQPEYLRLAEAERKLKEKQNA